MPGYWKMVYVSDADPQKAEQQKAAAAIFPPGTLTNLPADFIARCRPDTNPAHPECIVLCYTDGKTPHEMLANGGEESEKTFPSYKGVPGRKVSILGTRPTLEKGARVKPLCGNKYCVNQKHLEYSGTIKNQWVD